MKQSTADIQIQLQDILAWFESDDIDIDQAEKKYEEALLLIKELSTRIEATENSIAKLKHSFEKE